MSVSLSNLISHGWRSISAPREELRWVLSHDLPRLSRWELLVLLNLLTVIVAVLQHLAVFGEAMFLVMVDEFGEAQMVITPYIGAIVAISGAIVTVFLVFWCGRAFNGRGGFGDTILTLAWLQFILLGFAVFQTLLGLALPGLSGLVSLVVMLLSFWLFSQFVAELHGYASGVRVLLVTFAVLFTLAFLVVVFLGAVAPASGVA